MSGLLGYVKEREAVHRLKGDVEQADRLKAILEHYGGGKDDHSGNGCLVRQ